MRTGRRTWLLLLAAVLGALCGDYLSGLMESAGWAAPWHSLGVVLGAGMGLAFVLLWASLLRLILGLEFLAGLRFSGLALLPWLAAPAWRLVNRPILPPPHDLAFRSLQIFGAALAISGLALSFLCLLVSLARSRHLERFTQASAALRLGGMLWCFYMATGCWGWIWRDTGDQPHYLLMAESLAQDHDLDLANNYAAAREAGIRATGPLEPQYPPQNGRSYTEHKPLIAMLAAPLYPFLGGWSGLVLSSCIAAATAAILFWLILTGCSSWGAAWMGFGVLALNAAWWTHAAAFYPEGCGGLLLLLASAALAGSLPWFWAVVAAASMAWLNVRFYPPAMLIAILLAFRAGDPLRAAWGLAAVAASFSGAWLLNASHFGAGSPLAAYHSVHRGMGDLFPLAEAPGHALGQWLDQEYGLLVWAPVFAWGLPGLLTRHFRSRERAWAWLLPFAAYLLPVSLYWDWSGGMAPSRYLVPVLPVLAFVLALHAGRLWRNTAFLLAVGLTWTMGLLVTVLPWLNFSKMDGKNWLLKMLASWSGLDLTPCFPSFMMENPVRYVWVLLLFVLGWVACRRMESSVKVP